MTILLAYVLRMRRLRPRLTLHENVPQFPAALLEYYLGSSYHCYTFIVTPEDVGYYLCRRKRRYTICFHKVHT